MFVLYPLRHALLALFVCNACHSPARDAIDPAGAASTATRTNSAPASFFESTYPTTAPVVESPTFGNLSECPSLQERSIPESPLPNGQLPRRGNDIFAVDGRLIRMSSTPEGLESGNVYDTRSGTWQVMSVRGAPQYIHGPYISSPSYYVAGRGVLVIWGEAGVVKSSYYDPVDESWTTVEGESPIRQNMVFRRTPSGFFAVARDDLSKLFYFDAPSRRLQTFDIRQGAPVGARLNLAFVDQSLVVWNGDTAAHILDLTTRRWSAMSRENQLSPRWDSYIGGANGRLLVFGGIKEGGDYLSSTDRLSDGAIYDLAAHAWLPLRGILPGGVPNYAASEMFLQAGTRMLLREVFTADRQPTPFLHFIDLESASWRKIALPESVAFPLLLDSRHAIFLDAHRALVVDLEGGTTCTQPLAAIPFFSKATDATGVSIYPLGDSIMAWGRLDFQCPRCQRGAPCMPCEPPYVADRSDGVLFRIDPATMKKSK